MIRLTIILLSLCLTATGQQLGKTFVQTTPQQMGGLGAFVNVPNDGVKNAASYGFLPTSSATENQRAWNSIPSGGTVYIPSGTYQIDSTMFWKSNTTYRYSGLVKIVKTGDETKYCHTFINEHATSYGSDHNIIVNADSLVIDVNGIDNYSIAVALRMRAQVQLYNVTNFSLKGFHVINGGSNQYSCYVNNCTSGRITDVSFTGEKDGLGIQSCTDIYVHNITTSTYDDGIFIGAIGYNISTPKIGNCERITIDGWTDLAHTNAYGRSLLLLQDSWSDWETGHSYTYYEPTNNAGKIYRKANAGTLVASVAPTHTSGTVTGADGIAWQYFQTDTIHKALVKNITIKNVISTSSRTFINFGGDNYFRNKPQLTKYDAIVFDSITFTPTVRNMCFIRYQDKVGTVTVKNSTITPFVTNSVYEDYVVMGSVDKKLASFDNLIFDNCTINIKTSSGTFTNFPANDSCTLKKLSVLNSVVRDTLLNSGIFHVSRANQLDSLVLTNTTFRSLGWLVFSQASGTNVKVVATNCNFVNPKWVQLIQNYAGITVSYKSIGCTYTTPNQYLFQNLNTGSVITVNMATSIGPITRAKIRDNNKTTMVTCDLWHPYATETNALIARMPSPPSMQSTIEIDTCIVSLKTAGIWVKLDGLWVLAAPDTSSAFLNWIANRNNIDQVGVGTFTANTGWAGNGSSGALRTNFNVLTDKINLSKYSGFLSIYIRTNSASAVHDISANGASSNGTDIVSKWSDNKIYANINYAVYTPGTITRSDGLISLTRSGTHFLRISQNKTQLVNWGPDGTTNDFPNVGLYIGCQNVNGTLSAYSSRQYSLAAIGGYLTPTEINNFYDIIQAYFTFLGINI